MYGNCLMCGALAENYFGANAKIGNYIRRKGACPTCDRQAREEVAVHDREAAQMLKADGYREAEADEEIDGDVLLAGGKEWVQS